MNTARILAQIKVENRKNVGSAPEQGENLEDRLGGQSILLTNLQNRVGKEMRRRVDGVIAEFSRRLEDLAKQNEHCIRPEEHRLAETQEIAFAKAQNNADRDDSSTADKTDRSGIQTVLEEKIVSLEDRIIKTMHGSGASNTELISAEVEGFQDAILKGISEQIRDQFADQQQLTHSADDLKDEVMSALAELKASVAENLTAIGSKLNGVDSAEESGASPSPTAPVLERMEELESRLSASLDRLNLTSNEDGSASTPSIDLSSLEAKLEQIEGGLARVSPGGGETESPLLTQIEESVSGLRKQMSLLVRTINSNFEENGDIKAVLVGVSESLSRGGSQESGATLEAIEKQVQLSIKSAVSEHLRLNEEQIASIAEQITVNIKSALGELDSAPGGAVDVTGLDSLPEKISELLRESTESTQFGINAAMQDATDQIINRVEEMLTNR